LPVIGVVRLVAFVVAFACYAAGLPAGVVGKPDRQHVRRGFDHRPVPAKAHERDTAPDRPHPSTTPLDHTPRPHPSTTPLDHTFVVLVGLGVAPCTRVNVAQRWRTSHSRNSTQIPGDGRIALGTGGTATR